MLFLLLAYLHRLPSDPKSAIFIDFWGRFCVYSLWFIGYVLYQKYLMNYPLVKRGVILVVCANIPFFLLLAYFDKITMEPDSIVFVDFWGRLTVYSFWVICYETYRTYATQGLRSGETVTYATAIKSTEDPREPAQLAP